MQTQPKLQYPLHSEMEIREKNFQKIWINSHYPLLGTPEFIFYAVDGQ